MTAVRIFVALVLVQTLFAYVIESSAGQAITQIWAPIIRTLAQ